MDDRGDDGGMIEAEFATSATLYGRLLKCLGPFTDPTENYIR